MKALHICRNVFRECAFLCLAALWGHMCEEGKKGGRGELKSLYGLPRRNGGGDSIDRNSFVLELEKRFSESRFFMETRPCLLYTSIGCMNEQISISSCEYLFFPMLYMDMRCV